MINIKSNREIELMRVAGKIVGDTHNYIKDFIKPGITTKELDKLAEDFIRSKDAIPSFKNYEGFPNSICTSINEEVVHGIPSNRKLENGDIISIDIGANYKGYHGDSAWTYGIGTVNKEVEHLMKYTEEALFVGLKVIKDGIRVGDISNAIEVHAKKYNLSVIKELVGHGIGSSLHELPDIPNYGNKGLGPILKENMVIAIEPMLNLGTANICLEDDNWTIVTEDGKPSAHYEHTILVTKDGYEILTKR